MPAKKRKQMLGDGRKKKLIRWRMASIVIQMKEIRYPDEDWLFRYASS